MFEPIVVFFVDHNLFLGPKQIKDALQKPSSPQTRGLWLETTSPDGVSGRVQRRLFFSVSGAFRQDGASLRRAHGQPEGLSCRWFCECRYLFVHPVESNGG